METKKCPFCGEEIKAEAKKCRYCGEWLDGRNDNTTVGENEHQYVGNVHKDPIIEAVPTSESDDYYEEETSASVKVWSFLKHSIWIIAFLAVAYFTLPSNQEHLRKTKNGLRDVFKELAHEELGKQNALLQIFGNAIMDNDALSNTLIENYMNKELKFKIDNYGIFSLCEVAPREEFSESKIVSFACFGMVIPLYNRLVDKLYENEKEESISVNDEPQEADIRPVTDESKSVEDEDQMMTFFNNPSYTKYENQRYGFWGYYPSFFTADREPEDGDGRTFRYDENNFITFYGHYNVNDETLEQMFANETYSTKAYTRITKTWYVIADYDEQGRLNYKKITLYESNGNSTYAGFEFTFEEKYQKYMEEVLRKIGYPFIGKNFTSR